MKFNEVIGQEKVKLRLIQMEKEDRLPHAIMFCGPRGCGKMALALAFASYLLCKNNKGNDDSCGRCNQCSMLRKWEHPDLHFTFPVIKPEKTGSDHKTVSDDYIKEWYKMLSGGPYFSIDQWLDIIHAENKQAIIYASESDDLTRKLSLKSSQGGYKISIIWLPERMNIECSNKLLKLFEEPPSQTVFIMVCEEPEKLLDTIISRTQRIDIKRIDDITMKTALAERRGISNNAAEHISHVANGDWLKALEILDTNNDNRMYLDMFIILMRKCYIRDLRELKAWSEIVTSWGREKQLKFLDYCQKLVRENFMYNFQRPELCYMTEEEENFSKNFSPFINERNIIEITENISRAQKEIGQNANAKILFFDFAMKLIILIIKGKK
jgi:DNA polymerase III subunit delta'